ncbi:MAG TPA: MFS transporter, partial [Clostridia bacterium]
FFMVNDVIAYMIVTMLVGFGIACAAVYWQSLIQLNTPDNMTGRVFSVSTLAGNVSLPAAYGIFGILLTYISITKLMLFSGCCLILLCCVIFLRPEVNKD